MEIKFTEENIKKLEAIKSRYPNSHAALLPALVDCSGTVRLVIKKKFWNM